MTVAETTAFKCKCEECGHEWVAGVMPSRCAKCKSRKWNSGGPDEGSGLPVRGEDHGAGLTGLVG